MMPNPFRLQTAQQPPLAYNSMAELTRLAADTQMPLSQLKEMAAAQGQMQAAQETAKIEIPQVISTLLVTVIREKRADRTSNRHIVS